MCNTNQIGDTMTITTETTETGPQTLELPWEVLADLASAGASAGTDDARPILTSLHLFTREGRLIAEATDSYTLARVSTEYAGPELDALVPAKWLEAVRKAAKALRIPGLPVALEVGAETITARVPDAFTMSTPAQWGTFPKIDHLIPTEADYVHELGAFNPQFLARMTKILSPANAKDTTRAWKCISMSTLKPSLWTTSARGAEAMFLQMPVRLD